ncbi:MAG: acyl-CoA dehydratase activase [Nitrospirota bacterium]
MIRCGMDLGSRQVKLVLVDGGTVTLKESFDTAAFYREYGKMADGELSVDLARLGLSGRSTGGITLTVTGYGRNAVKVKGAEVISEVKAHGIGAMSQTGLKDFVLLDIGGQDTKVAKIKDGRMEDFLMNDKCAASSGRYIENMGNVLQMPVDEISCHHANPAHLSATCAIFGESEIIQKMTEGTPPEEIAAGVNLTVVKRVLPMLARFPDGPIVFAGGVARNAAVAHLLKARTGRELVTVADPVYNGALGCAYL